MQSASRIRCRLCVLLSLVAPPPFIHFFCGAFLGVKNYPSHATATTTTTSPKTRDSRHYAPLHTWKCVRVCECVRVLFGTFSHRKHSGTIKNSLSLGSFAGERLEIKHRNTPSLSLPTELLPYSMVSVETETDQPRNKKSGGKIVG